jgi:peptide/nickel transport system substrate-binding protein
MYDRFFARHGNLAKPAGYGSARLDALLRRGVAETDPAARRAIFSTLSRELLRSSPWAWVFSGYEYRVMQKGVTGFQLKPDGSMKSLRDTVVDAGV